MYGEKAQLLAYEADALLHRHGLVVNELPPLASPPAPPPPPPGPPPPLPPAYPLAPNICVEGGRIEFIRPSLDGAPDEKERAALGCPPLGPPPHGPPPIPPHGASHQRAGSIGTVSRAQQTLPLEDDTHSEEKCDLAKVRLHVDTPLLCDEAPGALSAEPPS